MDFLTFVSIIGGILAIASGFISLTKTGRSWWKGYWSGRQRLKSLPDIVDKIYWKVSEIKQKQSFFEQEMKVNGGSSIKDQINVLVSERRIELDSAPYPVFRTTSEAQNIYANHAYHELVNSTHPSDLMGHGWRSFLFDQEEGDAYFERWTAVSETSKLFRDKLKIQNSKGKYVGEWWVSMHLLGVINNDKVWGGGLMPADQEAEKIAIEYGWNH